MALPCPVKIPGPGRSTGPLHTSPSFVLSQSHGETSASGGLAQDLAVWAEAILWLMYMFWARDGWACPGWSAMARQTGWRWRGSSLSSSWKMWLVTLQEEWRTQRANVDIERAADPDHRDEDVVWVTAGDAYANRTVTIPRPSAPDSSTRPTPSSRPPATPCQLPRASTEARKTDPRDQGRSRPYLAAVDPQGPRLRLRRYVVSPDGSPTQSSITADKPSPSLGMAKASRSSCSAER